MSSIGWILPVFDLNAKQRELCQTFFFFSLKHPLFFIILFYFPFLFVWCWKSLWASPPSPPSVNRVVKCWWSPAQQSVAHLSLFNSLSRGMRGSQRARALRLSLFLNLLSLRSVCFLLCVCLWALPHRKHVFVCSTICLWTISRKVSKWLWLNGECNTTFSVKWIQFPHAVDSSTNGFKPDFPIDFCISCPHGFHWYVNCHGVWAGIRMSSGVQYVLKLPVWHTWLPIEEDGLDLEWRSHHSA